MIHNRCLCWMRHSMGIARHSIEGRAANMASRVELNSLTTL